MTTLGPSTGAALEGAARPLGYHPSQKLLHWAMAAIILAAVALGFWCSLLPPGTQPRKFLLDVHKSLGSTAEVLVVLRIVLRARFGEPAHRVALSPLLHAAARGAHLLLYAAMIVMPLSGYAYSGAGGYGLPWFGLFQWPRLVPVDQGLEHAAHFVHHWGAYGLYLLLTLHIAAVVWHRVVRRDDVLARML